MFDSVSVWIWAIVVLDLAVAVAAICALRYLSGLLFGVDSRDELAEKDNFAFGVTLAGGAVAVALVLAAATAGDPAVDFAQELGVGAGRLIHPLRVALIGQAVSPGIFDVLYYLGRDLCLDRIARALETLAAGKAELQAATSGGTAPP